jgi:hypothetical protein
MLCFVETKIDDLEEIEFPGFIIKMKNRFKLSRVKSGRIILGFNKKNIADFIVLIETDSNIGLLHEYW